MHAGCEGRKERGRLLTPLDQRQLWEWSGAPLPQLLASPS